MKILLLAMTIIAIGCGDFKQDNVKPHIPGTYTKRIINEYNSGNDTLIIHQTSNNVFRITRRLAISKIREGKQMPIKRIVEVWIAIYNENEQVLNET
jgi:hypothetical protein